MPRFRISIVLLLVLVLAACGGVTTPTEEPVSYLEIDLAEVSEYAEGGPQGGQFENLLSDLAGEPIRSSGILNQAPEEENEFTVLINEAGPGALGMVAFQVDPNEAEDLGACTIVTVWGSVTNLQRYTTMVMVLLGDDAQWSCGP